MGKKVVLFDSIFWLGFVFVALAFILQNQSIGIVGVVLQVLSLVLVWVIPKKQDRTKGLVPKDSKQPLPIVPPKSSTFFSGLFKKKSSGVVSAEKPIAKSVQPVSPPVVKGTAIKKVEVKEEKIPKIPKKAHIDSARIIFFIILVLALLSLIVYQALHLSDQSWWYYGLMGINVVILLVLFSSAKKIFRKGKSDVEAQAEQIVLEKEQELAVQEGKDVPDGNKKEMLKHYIRRALALRYSQKQIVESALAAGWPSKLIEECYNLEIAEPRGVESLIKSFELNILKGYLKKALEQKFSDAIAVDAALKAGWPVLLVRECIDALQSKNVVFARDMDYEYNDDDESHEPTLKVTANLIKHETDLDKVYRLVEEKKSVKLNDICAQFHITKKQAEEWAAILEKHGLVEMYYPMLGDPEIRWKNLKATE
ncbi:MAG: hypothetical protein Q7R96_02485 [Nanoarchaeota archaeon]|nr:hypothetical protein [Nanoarchaeota archaeon]